LGYNRSVPASPGDVLQATEQRWHDWFAAAPPVAERYQQQYYYAWWVMRTGLISTRYYMTREGMTPSKIHYVGVWQWDAFFHALAYRHIDTRLAEDQVRLVLDHQRADGMLPDAVHDEGIITRLSLPVEADVTKPPIAAWTALQLFATSGHRDFLDEVYEPLVRWNRWWYECNDDDGDGLCQYNHPFSSGLDDSPLWDEGMPVTSPDLNTYLCVQQQALAEIAAIIGEPDDATLWQQRAQQTAQRMVERLWDEEAGLFRALRHTPQGPVPLRVVTPFSLYPLWTGYLPEPIAVRLLAHLTDPETFWPRYPVPTVARNDPHYDPNQMWRGPTWVNVNYLFCQGLQRTGHLELARELRRRTLDLIMQHQDIYEYYHPETGTHPPKAAPLFGWTSALFIDMAIQASHDDGVTDSPECSPGPGGVPCT
jgi:glycogen debranching enzyme